MSLIKRFGNWLLLPYKRWKSDRDWKKKLKELREKDPFIYK